jgi:ancient ubiquitous protein 1
MSNTNTNIEDQFKYVSKFYDLTLINGNDITSVLKLILYFPIGLALLTVRLFLISILKLLLVLIPSLKSNSQFIQLSCYCYGIQTKFENKIESSRTNNDDSNALKIFISNHVSCLDYYSIKSIINKLNYVNSNDSLSSLCSCLVNLFDTSIKNKQDDDFYAQKSNYPLLFFPEQYCTNGRFGLLKFDSEPFDTVLKNKSDERIVIVPVCLKLTRPFIPLSINYLNSNDLVNVLFTLFAPITIYNIEILNQIEKLPDETSDQLNDRVRNILAKNLNFELSDLDGNQINYVWNAYEKHLENLIQQQQQRQQQNINNTHLNRKEENKDISFDDISRLALQIKDILPNVSFETIQRHVQKSSTLDIESIIASILDSNDHEIYEDENTGNNSFSNDSSSLLPTSSSSNNFQSSNVGMPKLTPNANMKRNNSSSSTGFNSKSGYKSFQERKFELLNEARQRYLAKHAK